MILCASTAAISIRDSKAVSRMDRLLYNGWMIPGSRQSPYMGPMSLRPPELLTVAGSSCNSALNLVAFWECKHTCGPPVPKISNPMPQTHDMPIADLGNPCANREPQPSLEVRKLEHGRPPSPSQRKKESQHTSSYIHG